MIIQVGKRKKDQILYTYKDVQFDYDGWADAKKYLPMEFDLCLMKTPTKTRPGWYCGNSWDGLNYKTEEVLYWKRKLDE